MITINRNEAKNIKLFTRIVLTSIAVLTIMMFSMNANASDNLSKTNKKLEKQITQMIDYPQSMLTDGNKDNGVVVLYFYLDEDGKIDVYKMEGLNESLNEYVANSLDGKVLSSYQDFSEQKYQIPIQFKTQK